MSVPRTATAAAATAVLLAVGLTGCGLFDRDAGERVLIVGDSVTYQSRAELKEEFAWADELDIKATSGLRTDELLPGAEEGASHDPSSAVFMPGYNDILQGKVPEAAVPEMMDIAAEVPCSVWLLIPVKGVYSRSDAEAFNARVRKEAEGHDNVHVIDDWARLVDRSQDFALTKTEDAVHPNLLGRRVVAQAMGASLKRECNG
jgi:hypothetical protein